MNENSLDHTVVSSHTLSQGQCILILVVAFLGWMFAGVQMGINSITHHPAASQLLGTTADPADVGKWAGWLVCAFLLGAAAGGYAFGWVGDRFGRAKAMAISIACYSVFSFLSTFSQSIEVFWVLRFMTCMGIGGMLEEIGEAEPLVERVIPTLSFPADDVWLVAHRELKTNKRVRRVFDFLAEALS